MEDISDEISTRNETETALVYMVVSMIRGKLISSPEQLKLIDKNSEMFKILHKDSVKFTVMDSFIRSGGKEYRDDLKTKQLKFLYENAEGFFKSSTPRRPLASDKHLSQAMGLLDKYDKLLIKYENLAKENVKQKEQIEFLEAALGKDEDGLSVTKRAHSPGSTLRGIYNLGNTCWIASGLQLLAGSDIVAELLTLPEIDLTLYMEESIPIVFELKKILLELASVADSPVTPKSLYSTFFKKFSWLEEGEEHDVLDLFGSLLPSIHHELQMVSTLTGCKNFVERSVGIMEKCLTRCLVCCSVKESSSLTLFLPLALHGSTLIESLETYLAAELLSGDNAVSCEVCSTKTPTSKQTISLKLSKNVIIVLKRYNMDGSKNTVAINFPLDNLDLGKITGGSNKLFLLKAVVVHVQLSKFQGHYYSYRKEGLQWFELNDSMVSEVSEEVVENSMAYVLLYEEK